MNVFTLQTFEGTCSYRHLPGIYLIHIYTYYVTDQWYQIVM